MNQDEEAKSEVESLGSDMPESQDDSSDAGALRFGLAMIIFAYAFMMLLPWVSIFALWAALRH